MNTRRSFLKVLPLLGVAVLPQPPKKSVDLPDDFMKRLPLYLCDDENNGWRLRRRVELNFMTGAIRIAGKFYPPMRQRDAGYAVCFQIPYERLEDYPAATEPMIRDLLAHVDSRLHEKRREDVNHAGEEYMIREIPDELLRRHGMLGWG